MLKVHHLDDSRSQRILWLLEELDVDYEILEHRRDPETMRAPKAMRGLHPLGKAPIIEHDGLTLAESGAVIEYIVDTFGPELRPDRGTDEFHEYRYWMHYAEGSAMTPFLLRLVFEEMVRQGPLLAKPIAKVISSMVNKEYIGPEIRLHMDFWESHLSEHTWFAGEEFTAADVQMSFPLEAAESRLSLERFPNVRAFLERIHVRPAYQRGIERGGPYQL